MPCRGCTALHCTALCALVRICGVLSRARTGDVAIDSAAAGVCAIELTVAPLVQNSGELEAPLCWATPTRLFARATRTNSLVSYSHLSRAISCSRGSDLARTAAHVGSMQRNGIDR